MKKLFLTLLVVAVTFASCKKDDDKKNNGNGGATTDNSAWIVGTWDATKIDGEEIPSDFMKLSYTFKTKTGEFSDASVYVYLFIDPDMPPVEETENFTYKLDEANSKIIFKNADNELNEIKIASHTDKVMILEDYDEEEDEYSTLELHKR